MFNSSLQSLGQWLIRIESCYSCGRSISLSEKICPLCLEPILNEISFVRRRRSTHCSHPSLSLLSWDGRSQGVCDLVGLVKGKRSKKLIEKLCLQFVSEINFHKNEPLVFVGVEGRVHGFRSHSYLMASCLSQIWSRCFVILRHKGAQSPQKKQSVEFRRRTALYSEKGLDFTRTYKYVFVDDIITSGATAQAAYEALDKPASFEIWTLFDRCLLHD